MLDTQNDDQREDVRPWAVRTRMLRKLRTATFRAVPADARRGDGALVIGEPQTDKTKYPPLPGAREEARVVGEILGVEALLGGDTIVVVNAILDKPRRFLHVAGHGDFLADGTGGIVLGDGAVFGPREIEALRVVPELAFINCCFLGQIGSESTQSEIAHSSQLETPLGARRAEFAANVAQQLIQMGVRCVVAAGWAVDDEPAKLFATTFYRALMDRRTFAEAVGAAREKTWKDHPESNTWAAYQCYGDPDWRCDPDEQSGGGKTPRLRTAVSPSDLALELDSLAVRVRYEETARDAVRARLEQLEGEHSAEWGNRGAVGQGFGAAYGELRDFDRAIEWYGRAIKTEDGAASLRASEQLANFRARRGANMQDLVEGRREILTAIALLERLLAIDATSERASLLGSAYKSLAALEGKKKGVGAARARQKALAVAAKAYGQGEALARANKLDNLYYPAMNRMVVQLMLNTGSDRRGFDPADVAAARQSLDKADPDFWSVVGRIELRMYVAVAAGTLAASVDGIVRDLTSVKARAPAPSLWDSVRKQAELVLRPILAGRGPSAERAAANRLLQLLETFAKTWSRAVSVRRRIA